MDQRNPNDPNPGIGTGTSGNSGTGGTSSGAGYASGGAGTGMSSGGGMTTGSGGTGADFGTGGSINASGGAPIGVTSGSDADTFATGSTGTTSGTGTTEHYCTHCGHALHESGGLEQFLGRLGISGDMFNNLKGQFQNVDIDEYLNTAREYLKGSSNKVTTYSRENPAKVAAGVAALALGAGLIYAAVNREKGDTGATASTGTTGTAGFDATGDTSVNRTGDLNRGYDPNRT